MGNTPLIGNEDEPIYSRPRTKLALKVVSVGALLLLVVGSLVGSVFYTRDHSHHLSVPHPHHVGGPVDFTMKRVGAPATTTTKAPTTTTKAPTTTTTKAPTTTTTKEPATTTTKAPAPTATPPPDSSAPATYAENVVAI